MSDHLMNTYGRQPVTFVKGEGVWLWDEQGNQYLDALAGVAVNGLGHAHPKLVKAIADQSARLIHVSNIYHIREQQLLADKLAEISGMDRVFFCNSGCEANEAAIKLARLHGHNRGIENPEIIVMEKAFHGRTMATLSATGNRKAQAGFEPLVSGFIRVPFDDLEAIRQVASRNQNVVAILVEPVQGEGGINVPHDVKAYLTGLREICDAHGWLLMLDEVQSGIGRTGTWFAFQHTDVMPDVMTLAKGLGSGVPIGACLAKGAAAEVFTYGKHGSTFGGNPLACTAGLTTLDVIEQEQLRENAETVGGWICEQLRAALADQPGVQIIRNAGMMIGIQLDRPCGNLVKRALEQKLLINVTAENVVRLLPPLV
ncbi:MAG: aspartate aminotransferase family protein, partial [Betaproteobacteria bacterium HGW-Betaproteobacteria-17]